MLYEVITQTVAKLEQTRQIVRDAISAAQRPVLALSGGKDSVMLLELCRPYRDRLHVVWARTSYNFV